MKNNAMQIFENQNFGKIRTTIEDSQPWFVAADVCKALGLDDTSKAVSRLDDDERGATSIRTLGGDQEMTIVSESGLYALILGSRKKEAKSFKRWVTHDVIPAIRKHGMYATQQSIEQMLADPDAMIATLQALKAERQGRLAAEEQVAQQCQIIAEMEPKVSYYDLVLQCKGTMTVSQIAKDYGESPQWLNTKLSKLGIQYKQRGTWLLYQKYAKMGYTKSKTVTCDGKYGYTYGQLQTTWTQKGRLFIYDTLKANGILPIIERDDEVA